MRLGGDGRVTYNAVDPARAADRVGREQGKAGLGFTWATGAAAPGVVLAVLPEDAVFGEPVVQPLNEEPFQVSPAPLEGTPFKAVAVVFEKASDAKGFRGIVWQTPDETMHGPSGEVAAAQFPSLASPFPSSVWADPRWAPMASTGWGRTSSSRCPRTAWRSTPPSRPDEDEITTVFGVAREGSTSLKRASATAHLTSRRRSCPGPSWSPSTRRSAGPPGRPAHRGAVEGPLGTARSTSVLGC